MSYAKVFLFGNLGRDPEMRYTTQGTPVCSFSLATSFKRGNEEKTTWWKVTFWEKKAELASQYLQKGRQVIVEGRPDVETYKDREGNDRVQLVCHGFELHFVGGGGGGEGGYQSNRQSSGNQQGGSQQSGGRPLGPKEQYRQAQQQKQQSGGGLSLDDDGSDDDPPF